MQQKALTGIIDDSGKLAPSYAYKKLRLIRRVEEKIERLYPSDKVKSPVHLSIGQEAVAVGVCSALEETDVVFSNYRGHAHYLAKGGDLNAMWAELYGKSNGGSGGIGGSMHLDCWDKGFMCTSAIVASGIPNAAGFALANLMKNDPRLTVCFHGDGATEEGVFWETLNFASLKNLPILFICENNRYAIYSHQSARMKSDNIVERAQAFGLKAERVRGESTQDFFEATLNASEAIKNGSGPILLECMTHRWRDHVGPGEDRHLSYRDNTELDKAIAQDELTEIRNKLPKEEVREIDEAVETEIQTAIEFAENGTFPKAEELLKNVWA
ncbi:thiamine pyrophosphate-dependent dehydrogenase E1 component subunit alpha [Kiloniella litopenaei]|uniref:thiamine pyrophosphate-dependent dehydrogenase E1 component subunit alpha n=1 Tax=Kiloniella litopenaei TaxID=1549748 RepID=UPI003BA9E516